MAVTYLVRKTGSDSNGGTSQTVRSSGSDGISNGTAGQQFVTSITAAWTAADIGHAINVAARTRLITAVTPQVSVAATSNNGSQTLSSVGQFTSSMVGQAVTGPGIAANTVIQSFTNANTVIMSIAAGVGAGAGTFVMYVKITTTTQGAESVFSVGTAQAWVVGGAWLTVSQALAVSNVPIIGGDTIYIGAGTYRENVTLAKSGSAGLTINAIGDVDGAVTGDAGVVRITSFLAGDYAPVGAATNCIAASSKSFWTFSNLMLDAGNVAVVSFVTCNDITFTDCTFVEWNGGATGFTMTAPTTQTAMNVLIDRCTFWYFNASGTAINFSANDVSTATGDWDLNVLIRNCLVVALGSTAININGAGVQGQRRPGGIRIVSTTFIGSGSNTIALSSTSVTIPCEVRACMIWGLGGTAFNAGILGQLVESENMIHAGTPRTNVAIGPNSQSCTAAVATIAPTIELGQHYRITGRHRPWFMPRPGSALAAFAAIPRVGGGGTRGAVRAKRGVPPGIPGWLAEPPNPAGIQNAPTVAIPNVDLLGRQRPAGGGAWRPAVGCYESHDTATKDTVLYDVTPASAKLIGPGDIELAVPVDASSVTISVRCYIGTTYSGALPSATIVASSELGVSAQTVVAVATWGAWQTLTFSAITPTAAGFIRLRMNSFDNGGAAQVNFDTVAAS